MALQLLALLCCCSSAVVATALKLKSDDGQAASPFKPLLVVPITTEAAMRDSNGLPIRDCLMPHIFEHGGCWYAFGFGIPANATGDQRFGTCYSSPDLKVWTKRECRRYWDVIYNPKNSRFVALGGDYGKSVAFYTSPTPLGPYTKQPDAHHVFGLPGDSVLFADDDGKAYLIYNRFSGPTKQRFTYIYQLNDEYTDVIPSSLANTTRVMEGLWMIKHNKTYYLFGSPLVNYDDADDFYLTAPSPLGPWTYRGLFAPAGTRTFDSQVFKGLQVTGNKGTATVFIGTRWCNPYPGRYCHPPFRNATSIWLPLRFKTDGSVATLVWQDSWQLDTAGAFVERLASH